MNIQETSKVLFIIPTYNEIENVDKIITKTLQLYPKSSLLIVDDNSPDGTAKIVKQLQQAYPEQIHLIVRKNKKGLGGAYTKGFLWGLKNNFEYFIQMDCDFSHDPAQISLLLEQMNENDITIGSRYLGGVRIVNWPIWRLVLSYMASLYVRLITSTPFKDPTSGFKCFSRKALQTIDVAQIHSKGYIYQFELIYRAWVKGLEIKEVPIIFYERRVGESKLAGEIIFEAFFSVLKLRVLKEIQNLFQSNKTNKKVSGERKSHD